LTSPKGFDSMTNEVLEKSLFLYTETSLHAGTGSSVSAVDLPIQRERTTHYPLVQGSGVKGALRSQTNLRATDIVSIFGPEEKNADAHAGAISVGDARIVLFPVRSLSGVFAYVTSTLALARLKRLNSNMPAIPREPDASTAIVTTTSDLIASQKRVVLEEYSFTAVASPELSAIATWLSQNALPTTPEYGYWRAKVLTSLILLPENDFRDFAATSTEITTHVRLNKATKTVETGALWTQEAIPSDALFVVPVTVRNARDASKLVAADIVQKLADGYANNRMQLGGDETTGQGVVALKWL